MSQYVHLVFSDPPSGVSDDEFNAWYDGHVQEILAVPGFESVRRYAISPVVGAGGLRRVPIPRRVPVELRTVRRRSPPSNPTVSVPPTRTRS